MSLGPRATLPGPTWRDCPYCGRRTKGRACYYHRDLPALDLMRGSVLTSRTVPSGSPQLEVTAAPEGMVAC